MNHHHDTSKFKRLPRPLITSIIAAFCYGLIIGFFYWRGDQAFILVALLSFPFWMLFQALNWSAPTGNLLLDAAIASTIAVAMIAYLVARVSTHPPPASQHPPGKRANHE